MLHTLSKALNPDDYNHLADEIARVQHARAMFTGCHNFDHQHRLWEYSLALKATGTRGSLQGKKVVDVGASYAIFSGLLVWSGAEVTANDVSDHRPQQEEMGRRGMDDHGRATPGGSLRFMQMDFKDYTGEPFDAVFCLSTIEHAEPDEPLFQSLLRAVKPGGTLVLTTDFHPSGQAQCTGHCRCYNGPMLEKWGRSPGFTSKGGFDYADYGGHVNGYNFASLVLTRDA